MTPEQKEYYAALESHDNLHDLVDRLPAVERDQHLPRLLLTSQKVLKRLSELSPEDAATVHKIRYTEATESP